MNALIILLAAAAAATVPSRPVVQRAVEKLDLSSFPNSLQAETRANKKTLRQFGVQKFAWEDGALEVTEEGGGFVRSFRPLKGVAGRMRLCMDEQATQGSYLTSQAIELTPARGGLMRGKLVKDANCQGYAR